MQILSSPTWVIQIASLDPVQSIHQITENEEIKYANLALWGAQLINKEWGGPWVVSRAVKVYFVGTWAG